MAKGKTQKDSPNNSGLKSLHDYKFWPHMGRVDNVFGDRNPACSCVGMENYS